MSSTELQSQVWIPCPDCAPFYLRGPADALTLATGWAELPEFELLLALLDADRRVTLMVTNPEAELVFCPERIERPGIPRPVRGVVLFSRVWTENRELSSSSLFAILKRRYRAEGIRLVDWVQIDFDESLFRSMRISTRAQQGRPADYLRAGTCV
jgi:hypothetical protein